MLKVSVVGFVTVANNFRTSAGGIMDNSTSVEELTPHLAQLNLTQGQRAKLVGISAKGIQCYLHHWLQLFKNPIEGPFCDAAWDEIYCWPPGKPGENASRSCSEVMKHDPEILHPERVLGTAFRLCGENGNWEWNGWTNYNQCIDGLEHMEFLAKQRPDAATVNVVRYIFLLGSILSVACILISLFVFYYFKSLRCDRVTIQVHLMLSLLMRSVVMLIITEPGIFQRTEHYRTEDWTCKTVMALQLYATVASVGWMFVQGHFLHSKLTTNVFGLRTPSTAYFGIGWGIPLLLVLTWTWAMESGHDAYCWKGYGKLGYIWILVGPMILALVVNLLFLVNIMRILLKKIHLALVSSDRTQLRRAVKATAVLSPLLGANNLLFVYNPGGEYEAAYMITNTIFQASQGTVVATLYCFLNNDVREAMRHEFRRYSAKRSTVVGIRDRNGLSSVHQTSGETEVAACTVSRVKEVELAVDQNIGYVDMAAST